MNETARKSAIHKAPSKTLLVTALAAASGAWAPVSAQTTPPDDKQTVIVTATLRRERAIDAPTSLSVVDPSALQSTGIYDINGIADLIPNFKTTSGGSPSLGGMAIRGIFSGSAPTVGIYVDDVPYGPVVGGAGSSLALDASLFDMRRIEVVRGPQGTLFGAGSMGGVVRYITDEPPLRGVDGHVFADLSNTSKGGRNTLLRGKVSFGVVPDKLGISVSVFDSRPEGFIDHPLRNATKVNGSVWNGGLVQALFAPTDKTSVRLNLMHHKATYDSSGTEAFDPISGQLLLGTPYTDISTQPTPRALTFDLGSLTVEHDFGFARLTAVASTQKLDFTNQIDITTSFGPIVDSVAPGGAPHQVGFLSAFETKRDTQEVRLASARSPSLEWIVGVYHTNQRSADIQNVLPQPADVDVLTSSNPTRYSESAQFGNVTYYISPIWDFTVGVRHASNKTKVQSDATGLLVTPLSPATISDTVNTYMFNTRYRVDRDLSLFARAASGYRPAGANVVTLDLNGDPVGQQRYESDSLWTYEIGAKGQLLDRRITYDVGAYAIDWKRAQIAITFANGLTGLGNASGGVKGHGLEAAVSGQLSKNFVVTGTLGLSNTSLKKDEADLGALAGERIAGAPKTTAALLADYKLPLAGGATASFGATWRYTGSFNSSYSAAALPNYVNPAFSQFDLRAGWQLGSLAANLYVSNVSDKRAYQSVLLFAPTYAQGVVIRPRTVGINVRYDFQ